TMQDTLFEQLLKNHKGIIYKVSRLYSDDASDQADLMQEIMINIWTAIPRFKGNAKESTWIYRIALNTSINQLKKKKKRKSVITSLAEIPFELPDNTHEPEREEMFKQMYQDIKSLPWIDKSVVLLYLENK